MSSTLSTSPTRRPKLGSDSSLPVLIRIPDLAPPVQAAPRRTVTPPVEAPDEVVLAEVAPPPELVILSLPTTAPAPQTPSVARPPHAAKPPLRSTPASRPGRVPPLAILGVLATAAIILGLLMLRGGAQPEEPADDAPRWEMPEGTLTQEFESMPPIAVQMPPQATPVAPPEEPQPDVMPWPRPNSGLESAQAPTDAGPRLGAPTGAPQAAIPANPVYEARRPSVEFEGTITKPEMPTSHERY